MLAQRRFVCYKQMVSFGVHAEPRVVVLGELRHLTALWFLLTEQTYFCLSSSSTASEGPGYKPWSRQSSWQGIRLQSSRNHFWVAEVNLPFPCFCCREIWLVAGSWHAWFIHSMVGILELTMSQMLRFIIPDFALYLGFVRSWTGEILIFLFHLSCAALDSFNHLFWWNILCWLSSIWVYFKYTKNHSAMNDLKIMQFVSQSNSSLLLIKDYESMLGFGGEN